ncbi:4,5-DOPA dioxygenase extradiol [Caproiciproducens sp. R1]|uniref:4,5-DOPA-extradiol-dioxygenase n=1 Tax=Caproiciproducens sp. R1 TaxID=3435000 RepID=UPI0040339312
MMPVVFVGHGSPMNAIEENEYTAGWREISAEIPRPDAILAVSAHWYTDRTRLMTQEKPKTIHDFYGFPRELYDIQYPAPGAPELAAETMKLIGGDCLEDRTWGIDHGAWSVLRLMYPRADIPVVQMSIDRRLTPREMFDVGRKLKALRGENVLIFGSGNVVHNLALVDFSVRGGYPFADEFDAYIRDHIQDGDFSAVIEYKKAGECAKHAFPTREHFDPLLYVLGAADEKDQVKIYNEARMAGSLSMTSYVFS